jgi:hypothetical protein
MRNVGRAYKQLIADWRDVLPAQSVCLVVPIRKPNDQGEYEGTRGADPNRIRLANQALR